MKQLAIRMTEQERAEIHEAARRYSLTLADYCRRVLLADARAGNGEGPQSLPGMVAEIHARICGPGTENGAEMEDAVAALVTSGLEERTARQRVGRISKQNPEADAEQIVAMAFKNGNDK